MKDLLKLFGGLDTQLTHSAIKKAKVQLAGLYILAVICIVSATTFFTHRIYVQTLKDNIDYNLIVLFYGASAGEQFMSTSASHLLHILLMVDVVVLVVIAGLGYLLASRTLRPVDRVFQEQKQFTEDVAHELRTPLTVIQTAIETLPDGVLSEKEVRELKQDLLEETGALIAMTNNLLTLSEVESDATQVVARSTTSCVLETLCKEEIRKIAPYAQQKNIQIQSDIEQGLTLETNTHLLQHIVKNLLKNAVDYTLADGRVDVVARTSGNGVDIVIRDTGVGIPPADQKAIFNRFYKSPHTKHLSQGSGLGLALVQSFTHALHGTVTLESVVEKGTTVTVHVPRGA